MRKIISFLAMSATSSVIVFIALFVSQSSGGWRTAAFQIASAAEGQYYFIYSHPYLHITAGGQDAYAYYCRVTDGATNQFREEINGLLSAEEALKLGTENEIELKSKVASTCQDAKELLMQIINPIPPPGFVPPMFQVNDRDVDTAP